MSDNIEGTGRLIGEFLSEAISQRMTDAVSRLPAPVVHFDTAEFAKALEGSVSHETFARVVPVLQDAVDLIATALQGIGPAEKLDLSVVTETVSGLTEAIKAMVAENAARPAPDQSALIEAIAANTAALQSLEAAHRAPRDVRYDTAGRVVSIAPRPELA
jgi:hypothetical protein